MPKAASHKSRLAVSAVFGGFAALSFLGGIASNILANYVSPWFDHHKWVIWLACGVAVIVAVAVVVWERADGAEPETPPASVEASGDRAVAIGAGNSGVVVTGDGNVVAHETGGDVVGRDKVTTIHHHHHAASPERSASHQLPAPKPDFTGRRDELAELKAHLRQNGQRGVAIAGAQGMGGVGKTELAVKLADELREDYPDAQIFLDLRGVGEFPVTPAQALEYAIRSLDPAMVGRLPEAIPELQSLYRSLLDGKRALLVWDNARDAAQVEPLIPPAGSAMIVTSRLHFTLPGLVARNLEALPEDDARQLLQRIAGRLTDAQAGALAKLCGRLPLALRLVGSALAERPNIKPEKYAEQLADEGKRLALVDASLSLSFALLDETQRRLWPRLAVFPATFDDAAAGAVWRLGTRASSAPNADKANEALAELIRYSLVDYDAQSDRYELHDLARLFADSRMEEQERHATQASHAQHFRGVLAEADNLYLAGGEQIKAGLALFDRERANIEAGMAWAASRMEADRQAAELCVNYVGPLGVNLALNLRQHPRERIRWLETQLAAARRLQRRSMEGNALGNLGLAYADLGEARKAIEFYEQALIIDREIGDRRGEGTDLWNTALALDGLGERGRAVECAEAALKICEEIESPYAAMVREQLAEWRGQS